MGKELLNKFIRSLPNVRDFNTLTSEELNKLSNFILEQKEEDSISILLLILDNYVDITFKDTRVTTFLRRSEFDKFRDLIFFRTH
jgi:hypothetical protein